MTLIPAIQEESKRIKGLPRVKIKFILLKRMALPLRAIETDQYRLVQYQLTSGEYYFSETDDDVPETVKTVPGGSVKRVPYSISSLYQNMDTPLVFLDAGSLTVLKTNGSKVFLLTTVVTTHVPSDPIPLVTTVDAAAIRLATNEIRQLASHKRFEALGDFDGVLAALHRTVAATTAQADDAINSADDSITFLQQNMIATEAKGVEYEDIHRMTVEQLRQKYVRYSELMSLVDELVEQKQQIEELTRNLQLKIKPIVKIADDMVRIT